MNVLKKDLQSVKLKRARQKHKIFSWSKAKNQSALQQ